MSESKTSKSTVARVRGVARSRLHKWLPRPKVVRAAKGQAG